MDLGQAAAEAQGGTTIRGAGTARGRWLREGQVGGAQQRGATPRGLPNAVREPLSTRMMTAFGIGHLTKYAIKSALEELLHRQAETSAYDVNVSRHYFGLLK